MTDDVQRFHPDGEPDVGYTADDIAAQEADRQRSEDDELAALKARIQAVADEYDREPRLIHSRAIADMLFEWIEQPPTQHHGRNA